MGTLTPNTKGEAFKEAKASGRVSKHEAAIMSCFETDRDYFSREDLSTLTDIKLSSICGAAFSLIQKGKLAVVGQGTAISGAKVQLLGLPKLSDRKTYEAGLRKTAEETMDGGAVA
jgi:hypothetical protein